MVKWLTFVTFFVVGTLVAQNDSLSVKIIFLYGSKPLSKKDASEIHHFGGLHGGHVSLELDGMEYGFGPSGKFHLLPHKKKHHSSFSSSPTYGKPLPEGYKYLTIEIPIDAEQKQELLKVLFTYEEQSPYDYAFFGMRCASNMHDLLAQLGVMKKRSNFTYITRSFYPKKLRKKLLKLANEKHYKIERQVGRATRKWEND